MLVYTSTFNAILEGRSSEMETHPLPYLPFTSILITTRTKSIARRRCWPANGMALRGAGVLSTCALRPVGIYGPGATEALLPRIVSYIEKGLFRFVYGDPKSSGICPRGQLGAGSHILGPRGPQS